MKGRGMWRTSSGTDAVLEEEQSLTAEPRREGSCEMENRGGTPQETAGSQENGRGARLAFMEKEKNGQEEVTS